MNLSASSQFDTLFSPLQVGPHLLPNRVVQSALSSGFAEANRVGERLLTFYANRARSGLSMIVTESVAAHSTLPAGPRVKVTDDSCLDGLKRWADAVESHGVRLIGQFVDPGRGRHHAGRSPVAIGASALPDDLSWTVPRALETREIARIVGDFAESANRLQRAGFSGIELSCGHGHLLHQFLSPQANLRTDQYGGSLENRVRFIEEIVAAVRETCGRGFIIGLKIPGDDGVPNGVSPAEAERILSCLVSARAVDYLAVAQGAHHPLSFDMHLPDSSYPALPYRKITRQLRAAAAGIPVLAVGRVRTPDEAEELLASEDADAVMIGRALLADPEWASKAHRGVAHAIRPCISCNGCWERTIEGAGVSCVVNPLVGHPDETMPLPAYRPSVTKRVAVIGGGPSGMEAALAARRKGHEAVLFSESPTLGGALALHAGIPGCEQLGSGIAAKAAECIETGVGLRLGEPASYASIMEMSPDLMIMATGAKMIVPRSITLSDPEQMQDLRSVIKHELRCNAGLRPGTAIIYDHDHTVGTYDATRFLMACYDRVVLVTPREMIARDTNLASRLRIYRQLSLARLEMLILSDIVSIVDSVAAVRNIYTGDDTLIDDVTLLAYSTPREPRLDLWSALRETDEMAVVRIGDCDMPTTLMHAVHAGLATGTSL